MGDLMIRDELDSLLAIDDQYSADTRVLVRFLRESGNSFDVVSLNAFRDFLLNGEQVDRRTGRRFHYAPRTVNRFIAAAKHRVRFAFRHSPYALDAGARVQLEDALEGLKGAQVVPGLNPNKLLTAEEIQSMIDGARPSLRLVVRFMASTGVRISEALSINLQDVRAIPDGYDIRVKGKGSRGRGPKYRNVQCPRELVDEIRLHFHGRSYLFEHNGKPFNRTYVTRLIGNLAQRTIGRDHVSAHCLRHSFATLHMQRGTDLLQLSRYLGHADISTTSSYYVHTAMAPEVAMSAVSF